MVESISEVMFRIATDSVIEPIRTACMTVSFVTWGFLLAMLVAEMFGAAFNPPILFAGMALFYVISRKYA